MVILENHNKCTGCFTCENICPTNAISMQYSEDGFYVPIIDDAKCIECNKCVLHCPILVKKAKNKILKAYVYQNANRGILNESTSGGAFTALAEYILATGGSVYGAAYDNRWRVVHRRVDSTDKLSLLRGSKYVQSRASHIFADVNLDLEMEKSVVFCGCPCQVAGLKNFLEKDYQNLLTIDLVCHGGASPELWDRNISYLVSYYEKSIDWISFRDKILGYAGSTMSICFGEKRLFRGKVIQAFKMLFFGGYNIRECCFKCEFKGKDRFGDITLFDCWHIQNFEKKFDNDLGATSILVNSTHGENVFRKAMKSECYQQVSPEELIALDGDMISDYPIKPDDYMSFWREFRQGKMPVELLDDFSPYTLKKYITEWIKPLLFNIGVLNKIKNILYSGKKRDLR